MRTPSNITRGSVGFNMTPMIDVVFLLIIFFLLSSHLAQQEVQLELDLPRAGSGQRPDEDDVRRVVINVVPEAESGVAWIVGGRRLDPRELEAMIDYESRRERGRVEVRIRCDRRVPYAAVEPVMIACARSGVWKATFAVIEE